MPTNNILFDKILVKNANNPACNETIRFRFGNCEESLRLLIVYMGKIYGLCHYADPSFYATDFFYYVFILSAELFIICKRSFFLEVRFNRWMPMNAIFIWKRDCRMGYVWILATIRNIKTLTSCAWLPFRFPFKCWPQIRKNPKRNYYRTTLEGERRVPEPCNPSMYNPWMYIHVKWGCHVQAESEKNAWHLRDNLSRLISAWPLILATF